MSEPTQEHMAALNHLIGVCDKIGVRSDRHMGMVDEVAVSARALKLIVEMARTSASSSRRIADEKAADYDAIVRLLHRGFKGG